MDTILQMHVGAEMVRTKNAVKHLGIMFDTKLTFAHHIRQSAEKAAIAVNNLSRIMANTGGPKEGKRKMLMTTVRSILLYGAEIWADALNKEYNRKRQYCGNTTKGSTPGSMLI